MRLILIFNKRDTSFPTTIHSLSMNCGIETPASNKQCGGLEARLLRPYN